jgi:P27 family predicted phage terminase small subunit
MTSLPKPPTGLLPSSRARWRAFWDSPSAALVNLESDLARLTRWVQAADEYERAAKIVRDARLVKGSMGQPTLNPLVGYLVHLEGIITRAETEFGMTPAARIRLNRDLLSRLPKDDHDDLDDELSTPVPAPVRDGQDPR